LAWVKLPEQMVKSLSAMSVYGETSKATWRSSFRTLPLLKSTKEEHCSEAAGVADQRYFFNSQIEQPVSKRFCRVQRMRPDLLAPRRAPPTAVTPRERGPRRRPATNGH